MLLFKEDITEETYFLNYYHQKTTTLQSKETTAQSYHKMLNENNIKKSYEIEFVFFNCEIDNLAV